MSRKAYKYAVLMVAISTANRVINTVSNTQLTGSIYIYYNNIVYQKKKKERKNILFVTLIIYSTRVRACMSVRVIFIYNFFIDR